MNPRTQVSSLKIEGYRSIRSLELAPLQKMIVLHGKNGSGKSNILRALRLAFTSLVDSWTRSHAAGDGVPSRASLSWDEAKRRLDFRPEDLHRPAASRVRLEVTLALNPSEHRLPVPLPPGSPLFLTFALALEPGDAELAVVIESAQWKSRDGLLRNLGAAGADRAFADFESSFLRNTLPRIASWSDAYRVPASDLAGRQTEDIEQEVFRQLTSERPGTPAAQKRLESLLGHARLFGTSAPSRIRPVTVPLLEPRSATNSSNVVHSLRGRVHVYHPVAEDLPLTSLGSGEQQVFLILARRVLDDAPIVVIEEPEAHLHVEMMRSLAAVLETATTGNSEEPVIDQLWLATHHHAFAIAPSFFEVEFRDGQTFVVEKNRAQAAVHFYEPGPFWDALRSLLQTGLSRDEVIFRYEGRPVTAGEIEDSERGDRKLFSAWVVSVTEMAVLSMKVKANAA